MSWLEDFRKFAFRGNVVDLAVGVVIGGAFGKIVSALVADVVMPMVALVMPSGDWRNSGLVLRQASDAKDQVLLRYGDFLGAVLDFFLIALVLFVVVRKIIQAAEDSLAGPAPSTTKSCRFCLETIPLQATRCRACTAEQPA